MARKRKVALVEPPLRHIIRVGRDSKGITRVVGYTRKGDVELTGETRPLTNVKDIDVGREFTYHVPSDGKGPSGFVFADMKGDNAAPWTPGQVLAAATYGVFNFKFV